MRHAFAGLLRHEAIRIRRYWLNYASGALVYYVLFLIAFYGTRPEGAAADLSGAAGHGLLVGFWVVGMTNVAFERTGNFVASEAMVGTLEQLCLSPFGLRRILVGSLMVGILTNLAVSLPLLALLMLTTGERLHLDPLTDILLVVSLLAQAYAVGLALGSLALIHKRIQGLNQAVLLLLLVCIAAPSDRSPLVRLLPLNAVWRLLRQAMVDGRPLWDLPAADLLVAVTQSALLVAVGAGFFGWCERRARQQGTLGQY